MGYRILPVDGTPYWLFGLLFLLLTTNVVISVYPDALPRSWRGKKDSGLLRMKTWLLWIVLVIVVGGTMWTAMVDRSRTAPVFNVHDVLLQQESAMRYLLEGKNPYVEDYFGTPMEEFNYDEPGNTEAINPALYHFLMPPWYLLFPFVTYFPGIALVGFFDGRFVSLLAALGVLLISARWFRNRTIAHIAMIMAVLSPSVIDYLIEGRSDMFAWFWFIWALYLLDKKKLFFSAVIFGLALMSKQTIWPVVPLYAIYVWLQTKRDTQKTVLLGLVSIGVVVALVAPFLLWDGQAFVESVWRFPTGSAAHSFPISGYGLGMLLVARGVIDGIHASYPFTIWQAIVGLPVLVLALRALVAKPNVSRLLIGYGVVLMAVWYTSRYLNNSHLGYLSTIFVLGILKHADEKESPKAKT